LLPLLVGLLLQPAWHLLLLLLLRPAWRLCSKSPGLPVTLRLLLLLPLRQLLLLLGCACNRLGSVCRSSSSTSTSTSRC
jgi:hypothetical protein